MRKHTVTHTPQNTVKTHFVVQCTRMHLYIFFSEITRARNITVNYDTVSWTDGKIVRQNERLTERHNS